MLSRRGFLASSLFTAVASSAHAQNFPGALIRIVVPAAPGGGTDILARAMSQQLQTIWGQTVIIENRAGAAGLIGTRSVIAAPGDGHTLLMGATSAIMALALNTPSPFEISRDLAPVTLVSAPPYILVAHPVGAGEERRRADRLRQGQSRQAQLRLVRRRRGVASLGRAVRADGGHRHAARALSRHGAGGAGPARRAHPDDLRAGGHGDAAHRLRRAAHDRHHRRHALGAVPGLSDHRGVGASEIRLRSDGSGCSRRRRRRRRLLHASAPICARCSSPTI